MQRSQGRPTGWRSQTTKKRRQEPTTGTVASLRLRFPNTAAHVTMHAHGRSTHPRSKVPPTHRPPPPPPTRQMRHINHLCHIKQRGHAPTLDTHLPHHVVVQPRGRGREAGGCRKQCHRRSQGFRRRCRRDRVTPVAGSVPSVTTANRTAATTTVTAAATATTRAPVIAPTTVTTPFTTADHIPPAGTAHTPTANGHGHSSHLAGETDCRW